MSPRILVLTSPILSCPGICQRTLSVEAQELTLFDSQESIHKTSVKTGDGSVHTVNTTEAGKNIPIGSSRCKHEPNADVKLSQARVVHPVLVRVVSVSLIDSIAWVTFWRGYDSHDDAVRMMEFLTNL
jgi:hypothetical protein